METTDLEHAQQRPFEVQYDLSREEVRTLELSLIEEIKQKNEADTIYATWIPQNHPYANAVRTLEAGIFPEIPEIMEHFEKQSVFLVLVDTREINNRIVHAFRLSSIALSGNERQPDKEGGVGIALIEDLINSEQGLTAEVFLDYYASKGYDLTKCVSVETNFRVGEKVNSDNGLPVSQMGYLAIFRAIEQMGIEENKAAVFAHLNKPAIMSLGSVGIEYEPIAGRDDLQTPTVGEEKFDKHYRPVAIPATLKNLSIFRDLAAFAAPEYQVK